MTIRKSSYARALYITLALLTALPVLCSAQPVLNVVRIINNWPTIELYFKTSCDGEPTYPISKQFYSIKENGTEVGDFTLWCPDPRQRKAISVGLVMDCSIASVNDSSRVRAIARDFTNLFDGIVDETSIMYAGDSTIAATEMTTNKTDIRNAINNSSAGGERRILDGVYEALQTLILTSSNPGRYVLLITAGPDSGSVHTLEEVVALANRNRINIYTCVLDDAAADEDLYYLPKLTGGGFRANPTRGAMMAIYQEMTRLDYIMYVECLITYQAQCQDGSERLVDVELKNFCHGGSDIKTMKYRAPRDTSTFQKYTVEFGPAESNGTEVIVPVVVTSPERMTLPPNEVVLAYGDSTVEFVGLEPAGAPFFWQPDSVQAGNGQIRMVFGSPFIISPGRTLFRMRFRAKPGESFPAVMQIAIDKWDGQCTMAQAVSSEVTLPVTAIGSVPQPTGIELSISPNPTLDGTFTVALVFEQPTAFGMRVVNALGQTVYESVETERALTHAKHVLLPFALPGVYFVIVEAGGRAITRKLAVW